MILWDGLDFVLIMCCLLLFKNPDALEGPRQVVVLRRSDPFPIGVVNREGKVGLHRNQSVICWYKKFLLHRQLRYKDCIVRKILMRFQTL